MAIAPLESPRDLIGLACTKVYRMSGDRPNSPPHRPGRGGDPPGRNSLSHRASDRRGPNASFDHVPPSLSFAIKEKCEAEPPNLGELVPRTALAKTCAQGARGFKARDLLVHGPHVISDDGWRTRSFRPAAALSRRGASPLFGHSFECSRQMVR